MATYCLVAGGGTAGHLLPGLAVADELVRRGHPVDQVTFVVSEREIDGQLLEPTDYRWTTLPGRGIQRSLDPRNLLTAWALVRAVVKAFGLVRRERPRVVLAVGGYASVSCALAALLFRVPLVVAEQNARAGAANRLVARWARAAAVPFPATDLPKAVVTGNPVRAEVLAIDRVRDRDGARATLGIDDERVLVLAFAGSLGATRINDAMVGVARRWRGRSDLAIRHVLGRRDFARLASVVDDLEAELAAEVGGALEYEAVEYESAMHVALAAADVAVCRAGGTTVAELAVVGLPAVLVPLPIATRDHQTANAQELVEAGAALLVADAELDTDRLAALLGPLVDEPERRVAMAAAASALARPDAGDRVTDLVEEHAMTPAEPAVDLRVPGRFHIVGIGGSGMSAIAEVLAAMGHQVSGSDLRASPGLERLASLGIEVHVGHAAAHVADVDAVARSTAIRDDNPELQEAARRQLPILRRAEILTAITATRRTIAVAGTHGKTTTSSMLALALREAGLAPSFIIGGDLNEVGSGAVWDDGEWLVVEADESDGTFLELHAEAAVLTSAEPDHLEHYGGVEPLLAAFDAFVADRSGPVVVCADDDEARRIAARHGAATYGMHPDAAYRIDDLRADGEISRFTLRHDGAALVEVELPVPGHHNVRNAAAAVALAHALGADPEAAAHALRRFAGVARRFQRRGAVGGVTFVDDYAHLPTEVAAAIEAAREGSWGRIVCVFQPHRYSRTASLAPDFADAFEGVDLLAVTDIYSAGEAPRPGVSGRLVLDAVLDAHPWHTVAYLPRRDDQVAWLRSTLRPGDLCLTLGAGDLTSLPDVVQEVLT